MENIKNKFTIFIDMDGVLCNFDKAKEALPKEQQGRPDLHIDFSKLEPMPDAIESVFKLERMGHDVFIASTPPWNNPEAWGQKRDWIDKNIPALKRRVFLTHRKDLLNGDILIDDTTYRGQKEFPGNFLHFGKNGVDWKFIIETITTLNQMPYVR